MADQAVDQLGIAHPHRLKQLRIHADVGEARQRVDLVDDELAVVAEEEVDPRQALAAERAEGFDRELAHLVAHLARKVGRDFHRRPLLVEVFGLVSVKAVAVARHDFAGRRGDERPVLTLEHPAFDLAAAHIFLDQDLAVVAERLGYGSRELVRRSGLADADRRAEPRGLDEHRAAELGGDPLKGRPISEGEAEGAGDRQAGVAHEALGDVLVHRRGRAEHARADIRDAGDLGQALDRPILAEGPMQDREHHIDRTGEVGRRAVGLGQDREPPRAAGDESDAGPAVRNGGRELAALDGAEEPGPRPGNADRHGFVARRIERAEHIAG